MNAEDARAVWVLTPPSADNELTAWLRLYEATMGPEPDGSVRLRECAA